MFGLIFFNSSIKRMLLFGDIKNSEFFEIIINPLVSKAGFKTGTFNQYVFYFKLYLQEFFSKRSNL
jgi:hypothetical protein